MRIGYPCINNSVGCTSGRTFRLASWSCARLRETLQANLECLQKTLEFNLQHDIFFFRITSGLVPFASHVVCDVDWASEFAPQFAAIGKFVRRHKMRVSTHPDQFVLINSPEPRIVQASIAELTYQARILELMKLDRSAKLQLHVGGVYGDKPQAIERFIANYQLLPLPIRRRLVIENDDRLFSVKDCLQIHRHTGVPILLDSFHHECLNNGEPLQEVFTACARTWKKADGPPIVDYSSQAPGQRIGKHASTINLPDFRRVLAQLGDCDVMLEIRDKEQSALKAIAQHLARPQNATRNLQRLGRRS